MRFGFQTILWGKRLKTESGLRDALACIAKHGFTGVEFAEAPTPHELPPYKVVVALLSEYNLDLLGICGGSLRAKAQFLESTRYYWEERGNTPYIYSEEWIDDSEFKIAFHYHYPMKIPNLAVSFQEHPNMLWLPDTAHLYIAGMDIHKAIFDQSEKLAAIHIKDWTEDFGRASYRYAKGFIELGKGNLRHSLSSLVVELKGSGYKGWVVAEVDYPRSTEDDSVRACAQWLASQSVDFSPPTVYSPPQLKSMATSEDFVTEIMRLASYGDPHFYRHAAKLLVRHLQCKAVCIWAYHNASQTFSPLATGMALDLTDQRFGDAWFQTGLQLAKKCVDDCESGSFRAEDCILLSRYPEFAKLASNWNIKALHCLLANNVYNSHQVRFVLHVFDVGVDIESITLSSVARRFSRAAEIALTERCVLAARESSRIVAENQDLEDLQKGLLEMVKRYLHCEEATVFEKNAAGKFVAGAGSVLDWNVPLQERYYAETDDSAIACVLREKQPMILRNGGKFRDGPIVDIRPCLLLPYFGRKWELLGVVRCVTRRTDSVGPVRSFSDDDLVVLETIFQNISPDLGILAADISRGHAISRLFHELAEPLSSAKSAIKMAHEELRQAKPILKEDYLGDAESWMDLAARLLNGFDFLNWREGDLQIERRSVLPVADIIAPAVRQVRALLLQKGFSEHRIDYGKSDTEVIKKFPELYVDLPMFQQVVFNFLTNAVKYAGTRARDFRVQIRGERRGDSNVLIFRDWGRGIPEKWKTAIFEEGVRVEGLESAHVPGRGLGLWVVRRIVELHKGKVELSNCSDPTEFSIFLPRTPPDPIRGDQ